MAKVLVSFIGRGEEAYERDAPPTATGYKTAHYQFPGDTQPGEPTSFFGAALLQYLQNTSGSVDCWLVLGTRGSSWATLATVFGSEVPTELEKLHHDINSWTQDSTITDEQIEKWQNALQTQYNLLLPASPIQCIFRATGSAAERESQEDMWAALLDAIHMDDEVTLDITHAFRHMPVLASFMLGALRWVRNLKKVDLYYGAYDMVEKGETVKVLHLPLVNELMNVAEAAATYEHTGNYGHILDVLGFKGDAEAEAVVYADELNRNAVDEATGLAERVKNIHDKPIAAALKPRVKEALRWVASKGLARQMGHKSMRACSNGQYSNAIALLYEAIRVAGCDDSSTTVKQDGRKEHNERIDGWKKVFTSASDQEKSILNDVEYLRNAVLHGLPGGSQKVERALKEPTHFHNIMEKGYRLLDRYLTSRGK